MATSTNPRSTPTCRAMTVPAFLFLRPAPCTRASSIVSSWVSPLKRIWSVPFIAAHPDRWKGIKNNLCSDSCLASAGPRLLQGDHLPAPRPGWQAPLVVQTNARPGWPDIKTTLDERRPRVPPATTLPVQPSDPFLRKQPFLPHVGSNRILLPPFPLNGQQNGRLTRRP